MGIFTKKAPSRQERVDPVFNRANLKQRELLRQRFGLNHEFAVYLEHAIGISHNCATINAKACTLVPLRLYKRADTPTRQRGFRGSQPISDQRFKSMRSGHLGHKLASFTASAAEVEEITDHAILDLLARPNPLYPGSLLEHQKWYSLWIGGNGYEFMSFKGDTPVMLNPMLSQFVTIEASVEKTIESYIYSRSGQFHMELPPEQVIHYKLYPSPHSPLMGIGALFGVLPQADLLLDCLIHNISMAKNGMHPDGIWALPQDTTPANEKKFMKQLESKFKGSRDWWKHLIFSGNVEFVSPIIPEKLLMSLPSQEAASKIIRQAFGHTESMAGSNDTTVAGAIQGFDKQFLGMTIHPALINDAEHKNQKLLPMFGLDPDIYCFAYDNPVERDEALVADRLRLDTSSGILTINEARVERGFEKSDDPNADKLLVNGQPLGVAPVATDPFGGLLGGLGGGSSSKPADDVRANGADETGAPSGEDNLDDSEEKAFDPKIIVKAMKAFESKFYLSCPCCSTKAVEDPDDFADDPIVQDAQEDFEPDMREAIAEILEEAQQEAIDAIMAGGDPDLADRAEQTAIILADEMKPAVVSGFTQFLEETNAPASAFDIVDERALAFLETYTPKLADDLMGTTADMAKEAVRIGLENGLSVREIADAIEGVPRQRAESIARTETQVAVGAGKREAMKEVGIQEHKAITAPGVRKSHAAIAAKGFIPIDEPFVTAGETLGGETFTRTMFHQPFGVNCRCGVVAKFEGADV